MAVTTLRAIVDGWEALVVEGVNRRHTHGPPESVTTEDLPCQFVRIPSVNEGPLVFGEPAGWPTWNIQFVILVEAVGQADNVVNFDKTIDMIDYLLTALRGGDAGLAGEEALG